MEIENKRRDKLDIIAEILTIAKDGLLKTQIMYRANLSFAQLNEYLDFLKGMNLLRIEKENRKKVYKTTEQGERYIQKYDDISYILGKENQSI